MLTRTMPSALALTPVLMDGAGNRFVALDWRGCSPLPTHEARELAARYCEDEDVDGLLLLEDAAMPRCVFALRYFNRDGSLADFCGNGARCAAVLGAGPEGAGREIRFETACGVVAARVGHGRASVAMPLPEVEPARDMMIDASARPVDFLTVGVPHAISWCRVDDIDIAREGAAIRRAPEFGEPGANANFAQAVSHSRIRLRTYERGVEAETGACGTGATATAIAHAIRTDWQGSVRIVVVPTSGHELAVSFHRDKRGITDLWLEGPAELVAR